MDALMANLETCNRNWFNAQRAVEDAGADDLTGRLWALAMAAYHLREAAAIMAHHTSKDVA